MTTASISLSHAAGHPAHSTSIFRRIAIWLKSARQARTLEQDLAPLSDEQRRDIGLGGADIAAKVDAALYRIEIGRLGRIPR